MDIVKEKKKRRKKNSDHKDSFSKKNKEIGADESSVRVSHD